MLYFSKQQTSEFPALGGERSQKGKGTVTSQSKNKPSKLKKEEVCIQLNIQCFNIDVIYKLFVCKVALLFNKRRVKSWFQLT